ncbi:MAG: hypothetical protein ACI4II_01920 [Acutalibacteraceae bacterium]
MAKNYEFEFLGNREKFLNTLNIYQKHNENPYYFDDYIVNIENDVYKFGVARGGHSGGYWYIPEITEKDGRLFFNGKIKYIDHYTDVKGLKKVINTLYDICLTIFLFLISPLIYAIMLFYHIYKKIKKIPNEPSSKTKLEDKLYDLMVNHLHCSKISKNKK